MHVAPRVAAVWLSERLRLNYAGVQTRPRVSRLTRPAEFEQVFSQNQRARTDFYVVLARPNQAGIARLGLVIGKRLLPHAVDRNRVKRCVRESFRLVRSQLPACDFVVRLIGRPTPGDEAREITRALQRAGERAQAKWRASPTDSLPNPAFAPAAPSTDHHG